MMEERAASVWMILMCEWRPRRSGISELVGDFHVKTFVVVSRVDN
jgi:hypothetical protein